MGGVVFKHWDTHLAKAPWFVNTRWAAIQAGPAQSKFLWGVEADKAPVMCMKNVLGKTVWAIPTSVGLLLRKDLSALGIGIYVCSTNAYVICHYILKKTSVC